MKKIFEKNYFWIILIFLFSLLAIFPLFKNGFYPFHDEPQIANLYEMTRAFSGGQIIPRWAPDFSYNYGYPFFNFNYPLPFYLGAFFFFVFKTNLIWSLKLVFALSLPLSGIAFFFLMRKFFGKLSSFAGSIVYLFTPYRAVDLYVRGAVGELWAFVFMPLVLLSIIKVIEERSKKRILFAGLSLAGLILAHNLTAIIFLPFVALFAVSLILTQKKKLFSFFSALLSVVFGLGISAYYWLPAIIEKKFIQGGTPYIPFDHFPFIKQLLIPSWGFGASVWGPYDGLSFQIGIVNLLVILIGIGIFIFAKKLWSKDKKLLFLLLLFSLIFSFFLMNIRSAFIWKILPISDYVQFPWRFLLLTTFFSSLMIGFIEIIKNNVVKKVIFSIIILLSVILTWKYFKPEKQILVSDDYYLSRFFADRTITGKRSTFSKEYVNYSEDYLPLTIWTEKRPSILPKQKIEVSKGAVINFTEVTPIKFNAEISASISSQVIFHSYYFPGWKVTVNEKTVETQKEKPSGDFSFMVPSGKSSVKIFFTESKIRLISDLISLVSLLVIIYLSISSFKFSGIFKR